MEVGVAMGALCVVFELSSSSGSFNESYAEVVVMPYKADVYESGSNLDGRKRERNFKMERRDERKEEKTNLE
jgi:hypothetical protein